MEITKSIVLISLTYSLVLSHIGPLSPSISVQPVPTIHSSIMFPPAFSSLVLSQECEWAFQSPRMPHSLAISVSSFPSHFFHFSAYYLPFMYTPPIFFLFFSYHIMRLSSYLVNSDSSSSPFLTCAITLLPFFAVVNRTKLRWVCIPLPFFSIQASPTKAISTPFSLHHSRKEWVFSRPPATFWYAT